MDRKELLLSLWVETYSDSLLRMCYLYLGNRTQAEDAVQDTWVKVWRVLCRENKTIENEKAWLCRIAVNTCRDYQKSAWHRHVDERKALEELPETFFSTETGDFSLTQMVLALPDREREMILLYHYQGLTLKECARVLHISQTAAHRRLKGAEEHLKWEWEEN